MSTLKDLLREADEHGACDITETIAEKYDTLDEAAKDGEAGMWSAWCLANMPDVLPKDLRDRMLDKVCGDPWDALDCLEQDRDYRLIAGAANQEPYKRLVEAICRAPSAAWQLRSHKELQDWVKRAAEKAALLEPDAATVLRCSSSDLPPEVAAEAERLACLTPANALELRLNAFGLSPESRRIAELKACENPECRERLKVTARAWECEGTTFVVPDDWRSPLHPDTVALLAKHKEEIKWYRK